MAQETISIRIEGASRRFGSTVAVDAVTLDVRRGEIFALVGPDGAGKTTLMRSICGALALSGGSISVDGVDVGSRAGDVQAAIGYMPQRFSLYPDLSVIENLTFYGDIFGVRSAAFERRANELLGDFALLPFRDRLAEQLSGGMKQKLALACCLIHSPSTILLDEPTAGVDPVSRREFWRILYTVNRSGTTILVSTPYMDEAERANRIAFMMHGQLVSVGTPAELKSALAGEVVEIRCQARGGARRALREDTQVRSVEIFGETLHALVGDATTAIPELQARLQQAGIADAKLEKIAPTLEDTFVARLSP